MFFVFGVNVPIEKAKLERRLWGPKKTAEALQAEVGEALTKTRPKPLREFATPDSATAYAELLRGDLAFRDVSVKVAVLTPPLQRRGHAGEEMDPAPRAGQHRRHGAVPTSRLDGGRFAPSRPADELNEEVK